MNKDKLKAELPATTANREALRHRALEAMRNAEDKLEALINMTSSGPNRNDLCDANIHLKTAISKVNQ